MLRPLAPNTIRPPFARYSHGIEVPPGYRLIYCSGQLGVAPDERVPEDAGEQSELCFRNIAAILAEAGMTFANIVRINSFVTDQVYTRPYMAVRDRLVGEPPPASTIVIVSGFSRPEFKVEVEVIAAGPV